LIENPGGKLKNSKKVAAISVPAALAIVLAIVLANNPSWLKIDTAQASCTDGMHIAIQELSKFDSHCNAKNLVIDLPKKRQIAVPARGRSAAMIIDEVKGPGMTVEAFHNKDGSLGASIDGKDYGTVLPRK
jgi:hypothetical protein